MAKTNQVNTGKQSFDAERRILQARQDIANQMESYYSDIMNRLCQVMDIQNELLRRVNNFYPVGEIVNTEDDRPSEEMPIYDLGELLAEGLELYKSGCNDDGTISEYESKIKGVPVADCVERCKMNFASEKKKGRFMQREPHTTEMYKKVEIVKNVYDIDRANFGGKTGVALISILGDNATIESVYKYFVSNNVRKLTYTKIILMLCGCRYPCVPALHDLESSSVAQCIKDNIIPYISTVRDATIDIGTPDYSDFE